MCVCVCGVFVCFCLCVCVCVVVCVCLFVCLWVEGGVKSFIVQAPGIIFTTLHFLCIRSRPIR